MKKICLNSTLTFFEIMVSGLTCTFCYILLSVSVGSSDHLEMKLPIKPVCEFSGSTVYL